MADTFTLSCSIQPQGEPLGLEIWINDSLLFDQDCLNALQEFKYQCPDLEDQTCRLKFVLKNKQACHTLVDSNNNIVCDSTISIGNICFDEINIDQIIFDQAKYQHNFNGHGAEITDRFYGTLGCNGSVSFEFQTPMYLWLLENI